MLIRLQQKETNLAHTDYLVFIDEVVSGAIRLWNEEKDSFLLFVELWNARQEGSKSIGIDKGDVPLMISEKKILGI